MREVKDQMETAREIVEKNAKVAQTECFDPRVFFSCNTVVQLKKTLGSKRFRIIYHVLKLNKSSHLETVYIDLRGGLYFVI